MKKLLFAIMISGFLVGLTFSYSSSTHTQSAASYITPLSEDGSGGF